MNSTIKTINERVSLRAFKDTKISDEHIDIIINSAMRAPTAGNMMMYSMIKITNKDTLESLSKSCDNQPFIKKAPLAIIFALDFEKWYRYYQINDVETVAKNNNRDFKGPTVSDFMLGMQDATIAAQNAVIAAESIGIGSCYIGDIMENYEQHKELLNLPDYVFPGIMLVFGYYPETLKRIIRPRFDKEFVVFEEKYQQLNDEQIKQMFKKYDDNFKNTDNKFGATNYAQFHFMHKTSADFCVEMERSVKLAIETFTKKEPK